jgi:3-O-methylgallate 3,4-dioxygenase
MAEIVLGLASSHSPMLNQPPELWSVHAENDKRNKELCFPPTGEQMSYEDALERADPAIAKLVNLEHFKEQHANGQRAIAQLAKTFAEVKPDLAVMVGDDQDEILFEDNMPTFMVYWGDGFTFYPRVVSDDASPAAKAAALGYGDKEYTLPIVTELGRHIIEYMMEHEFDVSHARYLRDEIGGSVTHRYPTIYGTETDHSRLTEPRKAFMPHAWSFMAHRVMQENKIPIVPIFQNTCYPPNQPTAKRCFQFGRAIREAIESWSGGEGKRVVVMTSGGLSHFVVDEELDRMALKGMVENDPEILSSLPKNRLHSAASETLNWVTAAGALEHLKAEVLAYEPVYRTPAGTGGGWAQVQWNS